MTKKTAISKEEINEIKKLFITLSSSLDSAAEAIEEEQEGDLFDFRKHEPNAAVICSITEKCMQQMGDTFTRLKKIVFTESNDA